MTEQRVGYVIMGNERTRLSLFKGTLKVSQVSYCICCWNANVYSRKRLTTHKLKSPCSQLCKKNKIVLLVFNFVKCFSSGDRWTLHWQEMPVCRCRVYSWPHPDRHCLEEEDAGNHRHPTWLPALRAEVRAFWEAPQKPQRPSQPVLQVGCFFVYKYLLWREQTYSYTCEF